MSDGDKRRDDITLVPRLGELKGAKGLRRAREINQRREEGARRSRFLFGRMRRRRKKLSKRRTRRTARKAATAGRLAARGGMVAARAATVSNPVTLALGALAVIGLTGQSLITGRSVENVVNNFREGVLGDMDERAQAQREIRDGLAGNSSLMGHIGRHGVDPAMQRNFDDLTSIAEKRIAGEQAIDREKAMQTPDTAMILIERLRKLITTAVSNTAIMQNIERVRNFLRSFAGAKVSGT